MVKYLWKFSKKTTSICWKIVEIFVALVLVLGALLLYHLHEEPINAMKYIPEIEQALLPEDTGYHLQAKSLVLTSDLSRDGLIQIDIEDLQVLRADNSVLFSVPTAQFSYDLWHILTLNYMPSTIIINQPFLEMIVNKTGEVAVKAPGSSAHTLNISIFKKMLARVLAIQELNIVDAHFHLRDNRINQEWDILNSNLELKRYFHFSNKARLNATLSGEGINSRILATAKLNRFTRLLSLETGIDMINLKKLSAFVPVLQEANLDTQLSIKAEFDIAKTHKKITDYVSKINFNAKTLKAGTLNLMDDLENVYHVESADINGTLSSGAKTLKIASSKVHLVGENPVDFYLNVFGIDDFLNTSDIKQLKTTLKATLYDVQTEKVPSLWPAKQGPDAHAWVAKNLSKGRLTQADFTLYFVGDELIDLFGDIHATGIRVDYLSPMKAIDNVSAQVLLYPDKVRILADKGTIKDLSLEKADLLFTDLDKEESWLKIDLVVSGPVQQALELLSSKPLEFPQMFDITPSMISGKAKSLVHLSFPLLDDLSTTDVQAVVHADITEAKVNASLAYLGLKNGTFSLDVSNEGLEMVGDILMKTSPLKVRWNEYFNSKEIVSEFMVSGMLKMADVGVLVPEINSFISGEMALDLKMTQNLSGAYSGLLSVNAEKAWLDLLPFSVQKQKNQPMTISMYFSDLDKEKGKLEWDITGSLKDKQDDLKFAGQADWGVNRMHLTIPQIFVGGSQFSSEMMNTNSDFSLSLKGKNWQAYDLKKMIELFPDTHSKETKEQIKNIFLDISLDQFSLDKNKPLKQVSITGLRQGALWKNFHMQAVADTPFVLVYDPNSSQFQGSISNLGDLMDRFNFSERLHGGKLSLVANQTKEGLIDGEIKVEKTELKETGFLMQAMTILGIVDAFRGKDMEFDEIVVPFVLSPDFQLKLKDAYAVGTNLGITFKGKIAKDGFDMSGSVVPAYAINSLPGKIPLLGWLFRDSEAGGLINVPFSVTGSLSEPEIEWNALKTVAPGALGRFFN